MPTLQTKNQLILGILDILQKKTDEDHKLTQKEIQDILEDEYDMKVDRKAVKRNLMDLVDFGYPIEHDEIPRGNDPDVDPICTNWHLKRAITDEELRLLIDSLLSARYISYSQCKDLIDKLKKLSSEHFSHKVKHVHTLSEHAASGRQLFYTIGILDEAIEKHRMVRFRYGVFHTDKQMHDKCDRNGNPVTYSVSPYQMAVNGGRYFMIANTDGHDDVSHYRVDRIKNIELLPDAIAKPIREVKGLENDLDLSSYMAEHIYMHSGENERVVFRVPKKHIGEVMDWFDGEELRFTEETDRDVTVTVRVNHNAMKYWALQYCAFVEILSPQSLRDEVADLLSAAAKKYQ